jgi:serine/threonine-protein kinase HipA
MRNETLVKLEVHLAIREGNIKVGQLADNAGQIYFEYENDFMQRGLEISPLNLPLKKKLFNNISRPELFNLPGVFYDSLPDGWGMLVMDRVFRSKGLDTNQLSPLVRLAYLGNRAIGALSYEPDTNTVGQDSLKPLDLIELAHESKLVLEDETEKVIKEVIIAGGSPGGARPKALIGLNTIDDKAIYGVYDLLDEFQHYIVKFPGIGDPKMIGHVEFVYSLLARKAGIEMPDTRLLRGGKHHYFAIKRFDRIKNHKLHTHTLAGLLHSDFRKPEITYRHLFKVTSYLTKNHQDIIEVFRRMVFNVLAFNRDDHGKNFSFVMDNDGGWRLSPAYDLVYSSGIAGWHTMDVSGRRNPTREDFYTIAEEYGIRKTTAMQVIDKVEDAVSQWSKIANEFEIPKQVIEDISKAMDTAAIQHVPT